LLFFASACGDEGVVVKLRPQASSNSPTH